MAGHANSSWENEGLQGNTKDSKLLNRPSNSSEEGRYYTPSNADVTQGNKDDVIFLQ